MALPRGGPAVAEVTGRRKPARERHTSDTVEHMDTPWLLLDVDGPFNSYTGDPGRLTARCRGDPWNEAANEHMAPAIG